MTVNERWRIGFEFRKGDAFMVETADLTEDDDPTRPASRYSAASVRVFRPTSRRRSTGARNAPV
jgi:hypothetical protein